MAKIKILADDIIKAINDYIKDEESNYKNLIMDVIDKDDFLHDTEIFSVLEQKCTVIYYPLDDDNDGFHVEKPINGEMMDFVYINTSKSYYKQVFAAAHEFGHILKVDEVISKILDRDFDDELKEAIINRFASEIMMPESVFAKHLITKLLQFDNEKVTKNEKGASVELGEENTVRLIANLMLKFSLPYDAIVIRMFELGYLCLENAESLLESKFDLTEKVEQCIKEGGGSNFDSFHDRKFIAGLAELLNDIEEKGVIRKEKIESIREQFAISKLTEKITSANAPTLQIIVRQD